MTTIVIGNGNQTVNVGSNLTLDVGDGSDMITAGSNDIIVIGNGSDTITIGNNDTMTVGDGNDTITIGDNDTVTVGNGGDSVTAGSNDTITVGDGNHTITAGADATITAGNGSGSIIAGANSTISAGSGNNTITAGPNSTITAGNGPNDVNAGANTLITLGNGPDMISAGTSDTINITRGPDTIVYSGLTPQFTVPGSLSVNEEKSIGLPITLGPPALGHEVINGFRTHIDVIGLDTADFSNFAAVIGAASQVGPDTVITLDAADTITLTNVSKSSLTPDNFEFFTGAQDVITIAGVPLDAALSAGTNNGGGNWTLTPAQLAGLQLNAGEPIGFPNPVDLNVTITNPAGQAASATETVPLVVNAIPPTVGIKVLAAKPGDLPTETRLLVTASVDDADDGNDSINRLVFNGLPAGVTLSHSGAPIGNTVFTSGQPGTFSYEVDVNAPANQSTNFNLGATAFADEPNSPEVSTSTSQNIAIDFTKTTTALDFISQNQSIWTSGTAFNKTFSNFLGIDFPKNFPTSPPTAGHTTVLGVKFGGSFGLKAGFQSDLSVNSGAFNGQLPFNVTLADTFNKTNDTLEILPTESDAGGGSFKTTGPGGSFQLDLVFDVFAKAFGGPLHVTLQTNIDTTLLHKNSSTLGGSFDLPDGLGTVAFNWPQVNTTGSNPNPGVISSSGHSKPIFQLNIDPIAVVLDAILGSDPLKGSIGSAPLQVSYTILAATLAPGLDVQQSFNLNPGNLAGTLKNGNGSVIPFNFGTPTIVDNPSSTNFNLNLTPDATLSNETDLGGQLVVGIRALKGSVTVGFPPLSKTASIGPVFQAKTTFGPAPIAKLYTNTFPVAFQSQNVPFSVA
jgi:hypothetical protein